MPNELKFRQVAGRAGLGASALGLISLACSIFDWRWFEFVPLDRAPAATGSALALLFAGLALWLQRLDGHRRLAVGLAALTGAAVIPGTVENLLRHRANLPASSLLLAADVALVAAALALLFQTRSQTTSRGPNPIWFTAFVLAIAGGTLLGSTFPATSGATASGHPMGTMAAGLLALGVGLACARPDQPVIRILRSNTAVGALVRRLLLAVFLVPAGFRALLVILPGRAGFLPAGGVTLLTIAFILLGLAVVVLSAEAAEKLDGARETAVQQELRLAAQLQEQAARRQENVGLRPDELHAAAEANARLALVAKHTSSQVDVSALRQDEERNRQLAQRLQLAADSAALGIWEWDARSQRCTWDERTLAIYGLTAADFHGTTADWVRCLHADDREQVLARHVIPSGGGEFARTFRIVRPDGAIRHIESRGVAERAADGCLIRIVGTDRDITAEREAAEQLTRLNERLRRAEELSAESSRLAQVGGWEIDLVTARVTWSGDTWRIHETEEDYPPTLDTFFDFFPPEARVAIERALEQIRHTGEKMDLKVPLITAKGRHRWVRLIGRTDFSAGFPVRTHGAIQDVTAIHESNEAQRRLEAQLFQTQKIDTMGTLAGGIAHDFNNLLTGIIGYQELMAETLDADHPSQAFLAEARNASLRARNLVEQILAFSRRSDNTEHAPLDLQHVIEDAHRFLRSTIPTQIAIETQLDETCGQVQADATQIHQVLMNLGSNAAHAMLPDGGTITIRLQAVRLQAGRDATLLGVPEGDYARITFSDTGHGMDAATQQRIFDPFFTTKKAGAGTGLGLAVVHGIVRTHHGAISVESTRGIGTTFFIHLPLCGAPVPPNAEPAAAPVPRGAGELVCVVDDESVVGRFTLLALENLGYRVAVFSSAQTALDSLRDASAGWELLLTDQTMPGMQGHELALAARQIYPTLPITIMSGYFSRIAPQMLAPIGRVELLGKPFTGDELARAVHRALHPPPEEAGAAGLTLPEPAPS